MSEFSLLAIDHVQLAMPPGEESRARHFYADLLGMREIPKPAPLAPRGGCWFGQVQRRVEDYAQALSLARPIAARRVPFACAGAASAK